VELKILLVVVRQTLGWVDRRSINGRKEIDWISGSQLQQKTGCSKRAITEAIDRLVKMKLIEILDDYGISLTASSWRQGKPRLYYRLHKEAYKSTEDRSNTLSTSAIIAEDFSKNYQSLLQKMRITKETLQK